MKSVAVNSVEHGLPEFNWHLQPSDLNRAILLSSAYLLSSFSTVTDSRSSPALQMVSEASSTALSMPRKIGGGSEQVSSAGLSSESPEGETRESEETRECVALVAGEDSS